MSSKNEPPASLYNEVLTRLKNKLSHRWSRGDKHLVSRKIIDADAFHTRKTMEQAVRYEFDDEACAAAIEFSLEHMGALAEGIRWIRPLVPIMWLECDISVAMEVQAEIAKRHGTNILGGQFPIKGKKLGFLIRSGNSALPGDPPIFTVRPINIQKDRVALSLTATRINPSGLRIAQISSELEDVMHRWLIGVEPNDPPSKLDQDIIKHFLLLPWSPNKIDAKTREAMHYELDHLSGYGRIAAALLFLLTHRKLIASRRHETAPKGPGVAKPYLTESLIVLTLPRIKAVGSLVRFSRRSNLAPKRLHTVEGHWCWSHRTDLACAHAWNEENSGQLYRCSKCQGARWFRKSHQRGDASRGFVSQRRLVKTEEETRTHA